MKILVQFVLVIVIAVQISSCKTQVIMSNGAFSDISLVRESKDYNIKRLAEINTEGNAVFGIPVDKTKNKKQGIVFRFNGINLNNSKRFLPTLSLIGLSLSTGFVINELIGYKEETVKNYSYKITTDKYKLGLGTSGIFVPLITGSILAIPIAGAINNIIWPTSAYQRAAFNLNSILLQDNPDIDVFLNPKYEIETNTSLWKQRVMLKAKVMGATIKED